VSNAIRLYHSTAATESHLGSIFREGRIRTTESNVSLPVEGAGPGVVWLSRDKRQPKRGNGWARGSVLDKTEARLTVELPRGEAFSWMGWARRHGVSARWITALSDTSGGSEGWYVIERPVERAEIVSLTLYRDGQEIVWPTDALAVAFDNPPDGESPWQPWPPLVAWPEEPAA